MPELAPSLGGVSYSRIRELAELAMSMDGVLRLYFGESNLPTPQFIKDAAAKALADGYTYYSENAGLPSLRSALAAQYARLHGVELDPAREIVITASGVQALNMAVRCTIDPGDEALVLTPAWPNGSASVLMASGRARELALPLHDERYRVDLEALEEEVTERTRLLVYTSPSNPLGWVATEREQDALLDFCRRHDLWLLADEVYERLWYRSAKPGDPAPSILRKATRDDAVVVVGSFSKNYCMTGWRLGWLAARADLAEKAAQLNEFVVSHAASFSQKAGETALADGEPWVRELVTRLRENRDLCLAALRAMPGVTVPEPDGAFYLFPQVDGLTDSVAFCRRLLLEQRVGIAPGAAFGAGGEGSLRLCYASERSVLEPALDRLGRLPTRRITPRSQVRDHLDLDEGTGRELRDLDGRARGRALAGVAGIDLVHAGEVVEVGQEHRGLHEVCEARAGSLEDGTDVAERLLGLLADPAFDESAGRGVDRHLPRDEHELPDRDRLGVRRSLKRRRRAFCAYHGLLRHMLLLVEQAWASARPRAFTTASAICLVSSPCSSRTCTVSPPPRASASSRSESRSPRRPPRCSEVRSRLATTRGRPDASTDTCASASSAGAVAPPIRQLPGRSSASPNARPSASPTAPTSASP